jgi:hypothetical protein
MRAITLIGVLSACAGCANEPKLGAHLAPSVTSSAQAAAAPEQMPKKTMADRVLTAIALERVTGLKPDPARLAGMN